MEALHVLVERLLCLSHLNALIMCGEKLFESGTLTLRLILSKSKG